MKAMKIDVRQCCKCARFRQWRYRTTVLRTTSKNLCMIQYRRFVSSRSLHKALSGLSADLLLLLLARPAYVLLVLLSFLNVAPLIRQRMDGSQRGLLR